MIVNNVLADGVYRVCIKDMNWCAGFVVENGKIKDCAPILKKNINHWLKFGQLIETDDQCCDRVDHGRG